MDTREMGEKGFSSATAGIPPVAGRAMIDVSKFPKGKPTGDIPAGGGRIFDRGGAADRIARRLASTENLGPKAAPFSTSPAASPQIDVTNRAARPQIDVTKFPKGKPTGDIPAAGGRIFARDRRGGGFASPQELESIRANAARATMSGVSPQAQALMSDRAKTILSGKSVYGGTNRLQQPAATPRPALPAAGGTSAPTTSPRPTGGTTAPAAPTGGMTPEQIKLYQQAYANRNNPFAKGRIQGALDKMTPEQRKQALEYARSQGQEKDWAGYKFEQFINKLNYFSEMNSHVSNFHHWVDGLLTEGYDLSDYTWDDMYEVYMDEGYGLYEYMVDYLISEGYANDSDSAIAIMANMSDEWRESIAEGVLDTLRSAGGAVIGAIRNPTRAAQSLGNLVGRAERAGGKIKGLPGSMIGAFRAGRQSGLNP